MVDEILNDLNWVKCVVNGQNGIQVEGIAIGLAIAYLEQMSDQAEATAAMGRPGQIERCMTPYHILTLEVKKAA